MAGQADLAGGVIEHARPPLGAHSWAQAAPTGWGKRAARSQPGASTGPCHGHGARYRGPGAGGGKWLTCATPSALVAALAPALACGRITGGRVPLPVTRRCGYVDGSDARDSQFGRVRAAAAARGCGDGPGTAADLDMRELFPADVGPRCCTPRAGYGLAGLLPGLPRAGGGADGAGGGPARGRGDSAVPVPALW